MTKYSMFLLLALILLFGVDSLICQMRFQTVQESKEITGLQPYRKETISFQSKCYLMCQRTPGQCCYVQFLLAVAVPIVQSHSSQNAI